MLASQDRVYRIANKVTLDLSYAIATTDQAVSKVRLRNAFALTGDLLLALQQSDLRESYDRVSRFLSSSVDRWDLGCGQWSAAISRHSDLLHQARVHEKTIKIVGDQLSRWEFRVPPGDVLGASLNQLEYVAICEAERLPDHWHAAAPGHLSDRATALSGVHCGLVVLAATLGNVSVMESERVQTAAIAAFGATLVVDGSDVIFEEARQLASV